LSEGEKGVYYIFSEKPPEIGNVFKNCPKCNTKYEPIIITPTMIKRYGDKLGIKQSWSLAEDSIKNADKIVFIGYSLSDSDYFTKYILVRALAHNEKRINGQLILEVITRADSNSETTKRYQCLFGDNVNFHREGFAKYVESLS
jgi:hypothetical protein